MKVLVISIYDAKIGVYGAPNFVLNRGSALRAWEDLCNDPQSDVGKHPSDYTLFEIGEWDDQSGTWTPFGAKVSLGSGNEFLRGKPRSAIPLSTTDLTPNNPEVNQ